MKAVAAAITLASVISSVMAQGTLIINTPPSLVECQPAAISFSGGTAPYFISVLPGGQSGGTPLEQFPQQATAGTLTWNPVDIAAGTSITLEIRDNTGATNFSSPVTIVAGTSDACLTASAASGTSAASSAASTPAALPSAASSAASSASSVATSAVSAASSAASSASSRVSSASSAASSASARSSSSGSSTSAPAATTSSTSGASAVSAGFSVVLAAGVAGVLRALLA